MASYAGSFISTYRVYGCAVIIHAKAARCDVEDPAQR